MEVQSWKVAVFFMSPRNSQKRTADSKRSTCQIRGTPKRPDEAPAHLAEFGGRFLERITQPTASTGVQSFLALEGHGLLSFFYYYVQVLKSRKSIEIKGASER